MLDNFIFKKSNNNLFIITKTVDQEAKEKQMEAAEPKQVNPNGI